MARLTAAVISAIGMRKGWRAEIVCGCNGGGGGGGERRRRVYGRRVKVHKEW